MPQKLFYTLLVALSALSNVLAHTMGNNYSACRRTLSAVCCVCLPQNFWYKTKCSWILINTNRAGTEVPTFIYFFLWGNATDRQSNQFLKAKKNQMAIDPCLKIAWSLCDQRKVIATYIVGRRFVCRTGFSHAQKRLQSLGTISCTVNCRRLALFIYAQYIC